MVLEQAEQSWTLSGLPGFRAGVVAAVSSRRRALEFQRSDADLALLLRSIRTLSRWMPANSFGSGSCLSPTATAGLLEGVCRQLLQPWWLVQWIQGCVGLVASPIAR